MERTLTKKCGLERFTVNIKLESFWLKCKRHFRAHKWSAEELHLKRHLTKRLLTIATDEAINVLNQYIDQTSSKFKFKKVSV